MTTSEEKKVFGPGHNCFTTPPDGKVDPLDDPNRHTRVQAFTWNPDGTPNFGVSAPRTRDYKRPE